MPSNAESPRPEEVARTLRELPEPGAEARRHSARLAELIGAEIAAAGGAVGFDRFMERALYAPGLGYYAAGARKFGAEGDFVTAPEMSPLFAGCLARQCADVLVELGGGDILEFGAGSGALAADLLAALEEIDALPARYLILEVSPELRARQRVVLEERVPALAGRVRWLERWPEAVSGVVLANEVLDAMPVHRFVVEAQRPALLGVGREADGAFGWRVPLAAEGREAARLAALVERYGLPPGYVSELNLRAEDWVTALGGVLEQGLVLLIDYGFPGREFYHPQRAGGTLMCHYRHRAHADPLILVGLQDITAHVDFTAVAEAAVGAGLEVAGFATQAAFLLATGLAEAAVAADGDPRRQLELAGQVRRLTDPGEMGELFKVLGLGRGLQGPLRGFALRDERGRL